MYELGNGRESGAKQIGRWNMVHGKLGKLSRSVSIIGVGATPFMDINADPDLLGLTEGDCFGYAALKAMEDAGIEPRDVEYFYHGSANPKMFNDAVTPAMQVAEWFGMRGRGSTHHSEACATGYVALEQAVMAVASGAHDIVLSGGVEMATGLPDGKKPACFRRPMTTEDIWPDLDSIIDRSYTRFLGGGAIGQDDWIDVYRKENGLTAEQVDDVLNMMSYQGRRAASLNPMALKRETFEEEAARFGFDDPMAYLRSPFNPHTTQYLRVTGNAPSADGAACFIVCPTEMAKQFKQTPIEVLGVAASCLESARPHLERDATAEAAQQIYELTGIAPEEIDLLLVNDFILSSQLLAAEEVGYLPKGEGWKYVMEGRTAFDGDRPINTNGGRTSYGHAFGASGAADIYEAVVQMRGQAGAHQVKKLPKTTMLRGFGGGQNVRIAVLRTVDE